MAITLRQDGTLEIPIRGQILPSGTGALDAVGAVVPDSIVEQLDAYREDERVNQVKLLINSPGGSPMGAVAIRSAVLSLSKPVEILVEGTAQSAATWFLAMGNAQIYRGGSIMVHVIRAVRASGTAEELKLLADEMLAMNQQMYEDYSRKTRIHVDEVQRMLSNGDLWMRDKKALELGFVDQIIEAPGILAACGETEDCPWSEDAPTWAKLHNDGDSVIIDDTRKGVERMSLLNKLKAGLGLSADATEEQVEAAVDAVALETVEAPAPVIEAAAPTPGVVAAAPVVDFAALAETSLAALGTVSPAQRKPLVAMVHDQASLVNAIELAKTLTASASTDVALKGTPESTDRQESKDLETLMSAFGHNADVFTTPASGETAKGFNKTYHSAWRPSRG